MRAKVWAAVAAVGATFVFVAAAMAGTPAQSAYSGVSAAATSKTANTSLPFTGISVWAVALIAVVSIGTGLVLRRRLADG